MPIDNQNFTMNAGDTKRIRDTVDYQGPANDIGGASVVFAMTKENSSETRLTKTDGNGIEITNAAAGELVVTLVPEDTEDRSGTYEYGIVVADTMGNVGTVTTGEITVRTNWGGSLI